MKSVNEMMMFAENRPEMMRELVTPQIAKYVTGLVTSEASSTFLVSHPRNRLTKNSYFDKNSSPYSLLFVS
jgi:hypothetical protein